MRIFVMLLEMSYYPLTENSVVQYNGRHRYDTDGIQEERVKCLQGWFIGLPSAGEGSRGGNKSSLCTAVRQTMISRVLPHSRTFTCFHML